MATRREIIASDFGHFLYTDLPAFYQVLESAAEKPLRLTNEEQQTVVDAMKQGAEAAILGNEGLKLDEVPDELLDKFQATMERLREDLKTATSILDKVFRSKRLR